MSDRAELAVNKSKISPDMRHFLWLLLAVATGAAAYLAPIMSSGVGRKAFAITILMLVMYITETVSLAVTSLIGCLLYWVWAGTPLPKSFSGFFNDTPWYVLGILLLGVAAESTGLAKRLAYNLICRLGTSYGRILAGMMVLNFLLTFIMPSANAKCLILCTISLGMLETFGMEKKSNIGRGLVLAMTYQASIFSVFLIAGAAAILRPGRFRLRRRQAGHDHGTGVQLGHRRRACPGRMAVRQRLQRFPVSPPRGPGATAAEQGRAGGGRRPRRRSIDRSR